MHDPICAPATPLLPSAVAIVRVSGADLPARLRCLAALPAPRRAALRTLAWDGFRERALVLFFPGPHSYTGEDLVEFHLHGNPLLVKRFLERLGGLGIRLATPGEFTRRALLNGKQSLLEADVILDVEQNPNLHDREIRIDNGWVVKIGRGLDLYQKPDNWFAIGANDLSLRKCLETKVDIFRT